MDYLQFFFLTEDFCFLMKKSDLSGQMILMGDFTFTFKVHDKIYFE